MLKATDAHTTLTYRLGTHLRRIDHPALLTTDGKLTQTFAIDATRAEIAEKLQAGGLTLHADDTVAGTLTVSPSTLPTLTELGRIHRKIWTDAEAINERQVAARHGSRAYKQLGLEHKRLTEQGHALDDLIMASPVETLSDALVLAVHAARAAESLAMDEGGASASDVHRALARIAVCLSYATGTDLSELGSGGTDACILRSALVQELVA